ncbi:MAG: DEAD/DEAH box helicase family protein [Gemmatales bacterium]
MDHDESSIEGRLAAALAECDRLRLENALLLKGLSIRSGSSLMSKQVNDTTKNASQLTLRSDTHQKVALFRSLFRGRDDVYAVRWEGKTGKVGYSPACHRHWDPILRRMSKEVEEYFPLTDQVVFDHLNGSHTIGVYPLLENEICWFLAVDFDQASWKEDVTAFLSTCKNWDVPASLERSRSGAGAHIWIFFEAPQPASLARKLGSAILTETMERHHKIGLDSYDRFFPSQDTMPRGGFGNLIALPLQKGPRANGNSVFVDSAFEPIADQWGFLSKIRRLDSSQLHEIVRTAEDRDRIIDVRPSSSDDDQVDDPWTIPPSKRKADAPILGPFPETVQIVRSNLLFIEKAGLPSRLMNRLHRLAAFQNPEFYKAQAMRLSTYNKPRIIRCAEEFPKHIGLPRGCLEEVLSLFQSLQIKTNVDDKRNATKSIDVNFRGKLRDDQQKAVDSLSAHDDGILCATTAFGKTIVALHLLAARKVNTLILVHRRQLLDQWVEKIRSFLELPEGSVGQIGAGARRPSGKVDVAVIQSLNRKQSVDNIIAEYGHVIVDECHHLSAVSFEQVLRQVKARYLLGLTATPQRKDGQHPIIMMQCGPIRFRVNPKSQALTRPFKHLVITRTTMFQQPQMQDKFEIHKLYAALVTDSSRNDLIFNDLLKAIKAGRSPILLTERTAHLDEFASRLNGFVKNVIVMKGGMGVKQRRSITEQLVSIPDAEERVLLATGRYIGEGFDDARLDTLFLALPISWRGTLQQYVGRLHRLHDNKREVIVYDYLDTFAPVLRSMYRKRVKGYQAIGYEIQ